MVKIAIVGEAYGEREEREQTPFVGASGMELTRMLDEAGIDRRECYLTNVFMFRPDRNDITTLCGTKKETGSTLPPLATGKYLFPKYEHHLKILQQSLLEQQPNIAIALGNTAAWALLGNNGISRIRGTVAESSLIPGLKVLPTYHPAAILRQWDLRAVTVLDLRKAAIESAFKEIRRPSRKIWLEPTLSDIEFFLENEASVAERMAFDIETHAKQITCIGFATQNDLCLVIPFVDWRKPGYNYWPTLEEELQALDLVQRILHTNARKVGQNTLYDLQYLWLYYGITVKNYADDTMLKHHALHPELQKGLGFLGSVYTSEPAWKMMRDRPKTQSFKTEE